VIDWPRHSLSMTSAGRRAVLLALSAVAVGATLACSPSTGTPGTTGTPAATDTASAAAPTTRPTTGTTPISYPASAAEYATAGITAWAGGNSVRLGQLTDPATTIFSILSGGDYNKAFHLYQCQGAAGSSICTYYNEVGDELDLRLQNVRLGGPHAIVEGQWHPITFPLDLRAYAEEAIHAWAGHNDAAVSLLTGKPGETAFSAVPDARRGDTWTFSHEEGASGHLIELFGNGSGDTIPVQFANPTIVAPPPNRHGLIEVIYYTTP
jgi:hypothetical protein